MERADGTKASTGDISFVKGNPIKLYDSGGVLLNEQYPENLVFYDGIAGNQIVNDYIYAAPTADVSLASSSTQYYPSWSVKGSKGTGFEIASNGDIKCNKNGQVLVLACAYITASSTSSVASIRITKNRTQVGTSVGQLIHSHATFCSQAIVSVTVGDNLSFQASENTASVGTLKTGSSIVCTYLNDYYVIQQITEVIGETYSSAFSKTSGSSTLNIASARKQGNVVTVYFDINPTAAISAGSDILSGTIIEDLKPTVGNVTGFTYYGSKSIGVGIWTTGTIAFRAVSAIASGENFRGSITYVL